MNDEKTQAKIDRISVVIVGVVYAVIVGLALWVTASFFQRSDSQVMNTIGTLFLIGAIFIPIRIVFNRVRKVAFEGHNTSKIQELVLDPNEGLNELSLESVPLVNEVKYASSSLKGMTYKGFKVHFTKFITTFQSAYPELPTLDRERFDLIFDTYLMSGQHIRGLADNLVSGYDISEKDKNIYRLIIQNALVYATACTSKNNIKQAYMQGKNLHGVSSYKSTISDRDYISYMESKHHAISKFVKFENHSNWKVILAVMGYLINSNLDNN